MKYKNQNFSDFYSIFAVGNLDKWLVGSIEDYDFAKKIADQYFSNNIKSKSLKKVYVRKIFGVICYEVK